jgi:hypothetical protein
VNSSAPPLRWTTALPAISSHSRSGFVVTRSRELLRRILKEHTPDSARQQLAARVVEHLEQAGFRDRRSRAGYEEVPADPEPRVDRFGRSAASASSAFNSAFARCNRFAAAFSSVRLLAAASSAAA